MDAWMYESVVVDYMDSNYIASGSVTAVSAVVCLLGLSLFLLTLKVLCLRLTACRGSPPFV